MSDALDQDEPAAVGAPGRRRRNSLNREVIVRTAMDAFRGSDLGTLTFQALGRHLSAHPTAIYRHFRDKDELLRAAADWLLAGALDGLVLTGSWPDDVRALVLHVRRRYLEHPGVVVLIATASGPLQGEATATEQVLALLRSGGLDRAEAARAFEVLQDYLISLTAADAAALHESADPWREAFADLPTDEFPNLVASNDLLYVDREARFRFGLDLLVDALDRRRQS